MVLPNLNALELFAAASIALLLVPGPAVLYVVTQSAEHGRAAGLASVLGLHTGTIVHIAAATIGLSALIVTSAVAFSVVKFAGAAYLVYLGIRKLLDRDPPPRIEQRHAGLRPLFVRGVIVNVLNPKTAIFFLAFLPQFVETARGAVWSQVLVLGLVFMLLGLVSDSLYALAAGTIGGQMRRRREAFRYASGTIFVGLGAVAALAKR